MRWLVTDPASGDGVFSKTLTSTGTASSQEYFNPTERIQVVTERGIHKNIRMLIATLHSLKGYMYAFPRHAGSRLFRMGAV